MAEKTQKNNSVTGSRSLSSRLQRRAPASLQITPVSTTWNVAIPLLSPLDTSPSSPKKVVMNNRTVEMKSSNTTNNNSNNQGTESEKPVFKKWQHPAAPFCYDPAPLRPSFVLPV